MNEKLIIISSENANSLNEDDIVKEFKFKIEKLDKKLKYVNLENLKT